MCKRLFYLIIFVLVLGFVAGVATAASVDYVLTMDDDVITGTITFDTDFAPDDSSGGVDTYIWRLNGDGPDSFNDAIVAASFNVAGVPETFDQSAFKFVVRLLMATSDDTPLSLFIDSDFAPPGPYLYTVSTINFGTGTGNIDNPIGAAITGAALTGSGDPPPPDTDPPTPDPATFASAPSADGAWSISMVANTGTDPSGVEYYFEETSNNEGGSSSDWQTENNYTDHSLNPQTQYTYRVKMRDQSPQQNETGWSDPYPVTTGDIPSGECPDGDLDDDCDCDIDDLLIFALQWLDPYGCAGHQDECADLNEQDGVNGADFAIFSANWQDAGDPPTPDPATFASAPSADSDTAISMTATTGTDATGPVEYLFTCTAGGGHSSTWRTSESYTDTGLAPSTEYTYTVQMRDSVSPTPNVGAASGGASATTEAPHILPVLVINEMMASNDDSSDIYDEHGDHDDWIEIYNPGSSTVNMASMVLADDGNTWTIPSGVSINGYGYKIFWADGEWADDETSEGDLHTNFKLSANGDSVTLYDTDGITVIDTKSFSSMDTDVSYGRYPNATDNWYNMANATKGLPNVAPMSGEVYFSRPAGLFKGSFSLGLTTKSVATIRYTTDGSKPTASHGQVYGGPFTVNSTAIIRAAAIESGYTLGPVETNSYISLDDVYSQPDQPVGFPNTWHDFNSSTVEPVDYGIDPVVISSNSISQLDDAFTSIATMSIVMDMDDLFIKGEGGIYAHPGANDQKPASVELIHSDGTQGFEINCNIRNHGGGSRDINENLKHSFRLLFNGENGAASKLNYPLFEGSPVDQFDTIVLRGGNNLQWNNHRTGNDTNRPKAQSSIRDVWARDTQLALGHPASRSRYVHLYLNGLYWGLYNPSERPNAPFLADHLGGQREDWDSINGSAGWNPDNPDPAHHAANVIDGDSAAWDYMHDIVEGRVTGLPGVSTQVGYDRIKDYLDVDNLIDFVITQHYTQNTDWEESNWYVGRRRLPVAGFKFFLWDSEMSFFDVNHELVVDWPKSPRRIYNQLRQNPEFRLLFADHLHRHFFNGGLMTPEPCRQRWMRRANELDTAIIGESARWGDAELNLKIGNYPNNGDSYTRADWIVAQDWILNDFMGFRSGILFNQYKAIGLYPNVDAPVFSQHGGYVSAGASLTMTKNGGGTIWYTTDGSDPRLQGGAVSGSASSSLPYILNGTKQIKARVRNSSDEWSALNEAVFAVGSVADSIRITEIMYHPTDPTQDEKDDAENQTLIDEDFEFIELKNIGGTALNLNLVRFTDGIDFTFPSHILPAGGYCVVVKNQAAFEARYPGVSPSLIAGTYTGSINNGGERIELVDALGETILNFRFKDGWYPITDGDDFSLNIIDPTNTDLNSWEYAQYWQPSAVAGGTPSNGDTGHVALPGDIVISEIMAHTNSSPNDWIELHNTSGSTINIAGWFLSDDDNDFKKYEIQAGDPRASIPPGGYVVFTQDDDFGNAGDLGSKVQFGYSELGETAYLCSGSGGELAGGFCTKEDFKASEDGVSFGRYTKSAAAGYDVDFVSMDAPTRDAANTGSSPKVGPVVISEIMYHPAGNDYAEYVEIKNISGGTVTLDDWLLIDETGGIEYYIPPGTNLTAGSYLLLTKNDVALNEEFSPASVTTLEWLEGRLSNGGEKIELQKPGTPEPDGFVPYIRVDRVNYSDGLHGENFRELDYIDPWPESADGDSLGGLGHSLHRSSLTSYGNDVANWTAGTPSPGS